MRSYHQLLEYIGKNYKNYIFIAVFYSLWCVCKYASFYDSGLYHFSGRMIGMPTLFNYDITNRVTTFYVAGVLFLSGIICFSVFAREITSLLKTVELRIINYTSLGGIVLWFSILWTNSINSSLELIYCIHKIAIAVLALKRILKKKEHIVQIDASFYTIAFTLGISVFFILNECSLLFNLFPKPDFLVTLFVSVFLCCLLAILFFKENIITNQKKIDFLAFALIPLCGTPLLSFLKDEIYLVLNKRQIDFLSPSSLYLFLLVSMFVWIMIRYIKNHNRETANTYWLAGKYYIPVTIFGLLIITYYSAFITISDEMYESGNIFLPIMEYQKFGVIPIFEKFNVHGLSEITCGWIYTFFNGPGGREILAYEFILPVLWKFLSYLFIYKFTRNPYIALFFVLFFPVVTELLPFTIAIISIFAINRLTEQKAGLKNYLLLFLCIVFLLLWNISVGYPALFACALTILVCIVNYKGFEFSQKYFLRTILIFASFGILLFLIISWSRNIDLYVQLSNIINYLASAQSYGNIHLGDFSALTFKIHHFVFPIIVIIDLITLLVFYKRYTVSRSQRFIYTSLLFLIFFYIFNFQRGLVAHTMDGGPDHYLSSFIYFILSGSVYLFFFSESQVKKFTLITFTSFFFIINYKVDAITDTQNVYHSFTQKTAALTAIKPQKNIQRADTSAYAEDKKFRGLTKLLNETLSESQTFIDFTNLPMLYFQTGKITPSFFYQNPLMMHNDHLQNNFLKNLENYDAPLLLYSRFPETFWDHPYDVPNSLRHYRMAEYFFRNYSPFTMVDGICVWKRNDFVLENKMQTVFSFEADTLKGSSAIYGKLNLKTNKKYYFSVKYKNYNSPSLIRIDQNNIEKYISSAFRNDKLNLNYFVIDSVQNGELKFAIKNSVNPVENITVTECDYLPDFYSAQPKQYELMHLPYIWAYYDNNIYREKIFFEILSTAQPLVKGDISYFNFSRPIDKSSGNTIIIALQCDNENPASIGMLYGSSKNGYKGGFRFTVPPGKGKREFAIRISSQYNWYSDVDYIGLNCDDTDRVTLTKVKITKGH